MGELTDINKNLHDQEQKDMLTGLRNVIAEVKAGDIKHLIIVSVSQGHKYTIRAQGGCTSLEETGLMAQVFFSALSKPSVRDFDEDDPGDGDDED